MIRLSILTITMLAMTASCAGPIQTRIQTQVAAPVTDHKQYRFTETPEQQSAAYQTARKLVAQELGNRNLSQDDTALMLVQIAFADRPASIAITAGKEEKQASVAIAKKREFLQACEDSENRLTIYIVRQADGAQIYSGSAAEYHCKGKFEDSLPHLVKAALSDLGASPDGTVRTKIRTRSGVE